MEENHKKYIQKHFGEPVENFEPDQLLSYLFQANIINVEDMEKVPVSYTHLTLPTIYSV